mgnify:CR=1 FL=1
MVILGAEALSSGVVTPYELRRDYRRVLPGVHVPRTAELTVRDRCVAAFLWSGRRGVISGAAAAAIVGRFELGDIGSVNRVPCGDV